MKVAFIFVKDIPNLGEQIKRDRIRSNKSLTDLASDAGISVVHWNRIENERIRELPIETLRRIEKSLGIELGIDFEISNQAKRLRGRTPPQSFRGK